MKNKQTKKKKGIRKKEKNDRNIETKEVYAKEKEEKKK